MVRGSDRVFCRCHYVRILDPYYGNNWWRRIWQNLWAYVLGSVHYVTLAIDLDKLAKAFIYFLCMHENVDGTWLVPHCAKSWYSWDWYLKMEVWEWQMYVQVAAQTHFSGSFYVWLHLCGMFSIVRNNWCMLNENLEVNRREINVHASFTVQHCQLSTPGNLSRRYLRKWILLVSSETASDQLWNVALLL